MGKEDMGMEPEDHDDTLKQDEEVASSIDNEEKDAEDIHLSLIHISEPTRR